MKDINFDADTVVISNGLETVAIVLDDTPPNPREWDEGNLTHMVGFHSNYCYMCDKVYDDYQELFENLLETYFTPEEIHQKGMDNLDKVSFQTIQDALQDYVVIEPLFYHDHSGIQLNIGGRVDRWDSGICGLIYSGKQELEKFGMQYDESNWKEIIYDNLHSELDTFNKCLRGECYGFVHYKGLDVVDSCWGFYTDRNNNVTDIFMEAAPELCKNDTLRCYPAWNLNGSYKYSSFDIDVFLREQYPSIWQEEMNKRVEERNGDYKIISSVTTGTGKNIVLGEHMDNPEISKYVTWVKMDGNYYHGHYFNSVKEAQISLIERAANQMGVDLEEHQQEQDFEQTVKKALEPYFSDDKIDSLIQNESFMQEVSKTYQYTQKSNQKNLIDQIEEKALAMNRTTSNADKEH